MASLFLGGWTVWTFTENYYPFLLFLLFGILGGWALGALNGRKARTQAKYKNEYTSYFGMALAAIIFLGIYFALFGKGNIEDNLPADADYGAIEVLSFAVGAGLMALFGIGLVVANSLTEAR
ncbi:MAG: hypothetical protein ACXAD7_00910 [Candidatus Kariarchaeaceae archaeon]